MFNKIYDSLPMNLSCHVMANATTSASLGYLLGFVCSHYGSPMSMQCAKIAAIVSVSKDIFSIMQESFIDNAKIEKKSLKKEFTLAAFCLGYASMPAILSNQILGPVAVGSFYSAIGVTTMLSLAILYRYKDYI